MADSSFGTGWPQGNHHIVTLVRKDGLRLPVHSELKALVAMSMDLTEALGYNIIPGQTWGYANRPISGTRTPSNHSWGTAVDINAPSNPYASAEWHRRNARGTKPFGLQIVCNIPQKVIAFWESQGFRWGGRYTGKIDPMHFEFMGSVAYARAKTRNLQNFFAGALAAPKPATTARKSVTTIAHEVIAGKWGNGDDRKRRLQAAGYSYTAVQAEVNRILR